MEKQRILIISLGELKDTIFTLPLVTSLKRDGHIVEFLTSEKGFEIVNKNPCIDRVYLAAVEQWQKKMPYWGIFEDIKEVVNKLKKKNYDIAIDCQMSFRSFPFILQCGAKRRLSYSFAQGFSSFGANELIDKKPDFKNVNTHKVEINLNYARYLNIETKYAEFILPELKYPSKLKMDKFLNFSEERPIILLAPDMKQGETAWHPKSWVNLVSNISTKYNLVVVGDNQDNFLATKMSHKNLSNMCGKTVLEDLRYLISISDLIVSNNLDTSAIAWAMNKEKIITLSTNIIPGLYNPYNLINNNASYTSLTGELVCQPCNKRVCGNGTYKCSHTPTVETVLNTISKEMNK